MMSASPNRTSPRRKILLRITIQRSTTRLLVSTTARIRAPDAAISIAATVVEIGAETAGVADVGAVVVAGAAVDVPARRADAICLLQNTQRRRAVTAKVAAISNSAVIAPVLTSAVRAVILAATVRKAAATASPVRRPLPQLRWMKNPSCFRANRSRSSAIVPLLRLP